MKQAPPKSTAIKKFQKNKKKKNLWNFLPKPADYPNVNSEKTFPVYK